MTLHYTLAQRQYFLTSKNQKINQIPLINYTS